MDFLTCETGCQLQRPPNGCFVSSASVVDVSRSGCASGRFSERQAAVTLMSQTVFSDRATASYPGQRGPWQWGGSSPLQGPEKDDWP